MNPETLTALQKSIAKWERNAEAKKPRDARLGPFDCPLCAMYWHNDDCVGCPVMDRTGEEGRQGSPYEAADTAHDKRLELDEEAAETFRAAARAEVGFLRSLLPEATA